MAQPFPEAFRAHLERNVPYLRRLDAAERTKLEGLVQVFLAEKSFEGCGGLVLTDEMRVTIAAQACLLVLHREGELYPELASILVYPSTFRSRTARSDGGVVVEGSEARLGESARGTVVLAWDDVLHGARLTHDGHNVVLHELAHQLDQEDGAADGAPILDRRSAYGAWAEVLGQYAALVESVERQRKSDLDEYGATNPAEFFAVVTEAFFERPRELARKHPALYAQLRDYYRQDPARRDG